MTRFRWWMPVVLATLCAADVTPVQAVTHPVLTRYTLAAFDVYLRGKPADPLDFFTGDLVNLPFALVDAAFGH